MRRLSNLRHLLRHLRVRPAARGLIANLAFAVAAGTFAGPAAAQAGARTASDTAGGWDSPRALALIEAARERRLLPQQDTSLRNYTARAEGFVYFYLDRRETGERTLVKTDQVALELMWAQPDLTRQRIVGLRDESRLPNRMYYHLDHLTVVQNGFGDRIRMGDGDEVDDVPHPAAAGSDTIYQFRLADSLTLSLPGAPEAIRVYELQVRPRRTDRPALVGSVFVDRANADVVRMTFTFTPVSYVDRRLDHISVSLDNGLWEGKYWLPHEQSLLIRRQLPELDFAAGAVIQGRMRIRDYAFNDSIPRSAFFGPAVTAVPESERRTFAFERGIHDDLNEAGLAPPGDLSSVREEAASLLGVRRLSGLPSWRPSLGSASNALRYNRAEGVAAGAGLSWTGGTSWQVHAHGGYAFGAEQGWGELSVRRQAGSAGQAMLRVLANDRRDLGVRPALPEAINTVSAALGGGDFTDLYFVSGARLSVSHPLSGGWVGGTELVGERHRSARLVHDEPVFDDDARFRPVLPIDDGDISAFRLSLERPVTDARASAWGASLALEVGAFDDGAYIRPMGEFSLRRADAALDRYAQLRLAGGLVAGEPPSQRLFLLGGQNTLPGYRHRSFAGRHFAIADIELGATVLSPWIGVHVIGAAGVAGGLPTVTSPTGPVGEPTPEEPRPAWMDWQRTGTDGIRTAVGGGVSLFFDLIRVQAVRGLDGGKWRWYLSFHPDFQDIS